MEIHVFERHDSRLGRHQLHDPQSRGFALTDTLLPTAPVLHERHVPIFDQGQLGSCTGNAALGVLVTGDRWKGQVYTEADAVELYHEETLIDDTQIPGHYPPQDTGSTGLWSAKALRNRGTIQGYLHAFHYKTALAELARHPVSIGVPWFHSMFTPDADGLVNVDPYSGVAGGHQVCLDGIDPVQHRVRFANSWGAGWGVQGWGWLTWADFAWLLAQGGDVTSFVF